MTRPADVPLPAREAYRLWAPGYGVETVVSALENAAVRRITPPLAGRALLDAGCGTGRRLPSSGAGLRHVVGTDLVPDMLATRLVAPRSSRTHRTALVAADVCALPLRAATFDVVWCRLVLGHLERIEPAYDELRRVAARGAQLVVSDFHPCAVAAGHRRTFRDAAGVLHEVRHHEHRAEDHVAAAARTGWRLDSCTDVRVGPAVRRYYERAGAIDAYREQSGMPLVLLLSFVA